MPVIDTPGADDKDKTDDPATADDKRQGPGVDETATSTSETEGGPTE
jgi:hypothetical protein